MKKRANLILIALILIGLAGLSFFLTQPKTAEVITEESEVCGLGGGCSISDKRVIGYNVGNQLPNLELKTLDGDVVYLYDMLKGKDKFILSLSADWCSDCQRQDQKLSDYYPKLPDNYGAAVLFVDYTSADKTKTTNKKQVKEFTDKMNYNFPYFWDENNSIAKKFGGVLATPTNIVLDSNAIIKAKTEEIDMDILFMDNKETSADFLSEEQGV